MAVYREIPLSFGTLVLVHPVENPAAVHANWKVSLPTSLYQAPNYLDCDFESLDANTEKDPLDLEIEDQSVARSTTGQEVSVADVSKNASDKGSGGCQLSEPYSSVVNGEFTPKLSPLPSLWADDAFDGTAPDLNVNIGPTIRGTATAQKPHVCEVCGRPFRRKKDIRRHGSTHSNDKPFFCWVCWLTFRSREYLRRHLKRVHGQWHPSEDGEPRSGLPRVEQRQWPAEEPRVAEQNMTEHTQNDGRGNELGFKIKVSEEQQSSPLQYHTAEEVVTDVDASERFDEDAEMRGIDVKVDTEKASVKFQVSDQKMIVPELASSVHEPSSRCSLPQPKKTVCALYLCDGCGSLMSHRNVMVLSNKQAVSAAKPRVLCKTCFIKKTGIICIG